MNVDMPANVMAFLQMCNYGSFKFIPNPLESIVYGFEPVEIEMDEIDPDQSKSPESF